MNSHIAPLPQHTQDALARFGAGIDALQAEHQSYFAQTPSPLSERAGAPAELRDFFLMLAGEAKVHLAILDELPASIADQVRQLHQQEFGTAVAN